MRLLDELHLKLAVLRSSQADPGAAERGARGRSPARATLMRRMGIEAIYRKPRTSIPARAVCDLPVPARRA